MVHGGYVHGYRSGNGDDVIDGYGIENGNGDGNGELSTKRKRNYIYIYIYIYGMPMPGAATAASPSRPARPSGKCRTPP